MTAFERGWSTLKNGELLDIAEEEGFEVLITTDLNLRHQAPPTRPIASVERRDQRIDCIGTSENSSETTRSYCAEHVNTFGARYLFFRRRARGLCPR